MTIYKVGRDYEVHTPTHIHTFTTLQAAKAYVRQQARQAKQAGRQQA